MHCNYARRTCQHSVVLSFDGPSEEFMETKQDVELLTFRSSFDDKFVCLFVFFFLSTTYSCLSNCNIASKTAHAR